MIRCNLAVLLAERGLKISKVSEDTKISRTTLTSLTSNHSQGIQFDTLNILCAYLNVSPEKIISFCPVDITNIEISIPEMEQYSVSDSPYYIDLRMDIKLKNLLTSCYLYGTLYPHFEGNIFTGYEANFKLWDPSDIEAPAYTLTINRVLIEAFHKLPQSFLTDFEDIVNDKIYQEMQPNFFSDQIAPVKKFYITFPPELIAND